MTKLILSFSILCLTIIPKAQAPNPQNKRMVTITLTENTWRVLSNALDNSNMPHLTIKALQDSIGIQFSDTIKNPLVK